MPHTAQKCWLQRQIMWLQPISLFSMGVRQLGHLSSPCRACPPTQIALQTAVLHFVLMHQSPTPPRTKITLIYTKVLGSNPALFPTHKACIRSLPLAIRKKKSPFTWRYCVGSTLLSRLHCSYSLHVRSCCPRSPHPPSRPTQRPSSFPAHEPLHPLHLPGPLPHTRKWLQRGDLTPSLPPSLCPSIPPSLPPRLSLSLRTNRSTPCTCLSLWPIQGNGCSEGV